VSSQRTTFRELCRRALRLRQLYRRARHIRDDGTQPHFCANAHWYGYGASAGDGSLRGQLEGLVGWAVEERSGDPRLATREAFDVAYHEIYGALPPCRNCSCVAFDLVMQVRRQGEELPYEPADGN
jgi:hypothetical protein